MRYYPYIYLEALRKTKNLSALAKIRTEHLTKSERVSPEPTCSVLWTYKYLAYFFLRAEERR
jgi:hypothetical protein